jgi:ribosome-associated protein
MKGEEVLLLDLRELTIVTDFFVICGSVSVVGVKAIAEEILHRFKEEGITPNHIEGLAEGNWVLLDYGDMIVHIFHEQIRELFDIESLWGDAPRRSFRPKPRKVASKEKSKK